MEITIWHIWQQMWCSQGSVLQFSRCFPKVAWLFLRKGCVIFFLRDCIIFYVKRLRDFLCKEIAWFWVWRGFLMKIFFWWNFFFGWKKFFLVTTVTTILWRGCIIFFGGEVAWFWFCKVAWFCVWRGCGIFVCGEVVWFFSLAHSGSMI